MRPYVKIRQSLTGQIQTDFLRNYISTDLIRRKPLRKLLCPFLNQIQSSYGESITRNRKMKKVAGFIVSLFLLTFAFAPSRMLALPPPPPPFYPTLISPAAGQVLYPGQKVRVEWRTSIPNQLPYPAWCEIELWLSLDGGRTYTVRITPSMDPNTRFFYWTVPNTPTNSALLDIRFGCEPSYPETYHTQNGSPFVISNSNSLSN